MSFIVGPTQQLPNVTLLQNPLIVNLTVNNTVITVGNTQVILLSSNNATAANRLFYLTAGSATGHLLVIKWGGTNSGRLSDNLTSGGSAVARLAGNWTGTDDGTLTVMWDATNVEWVELTRSNN